ncbi:sarcosine oxidase subunit alpha family protein [Frigidibacter sp. MR17.24]|uniref:sarcosine oxidase subunit alpha family protein n=1 Tax=Frigidibacter sp. MR17.24 TaxID=3127345 RepID=UPI003012FC9D
MRIAGKGLVDRAAPVGFRFDGREMQGLAGDTLASALLANGVRLVGRSFKYHRPRGIVTAGSEEPNALVTTGQGADTTPNVRATMQEVFEGLHAESQNRFPSLGLDLLAVNDLLSPFFGAGFYYKTFMWPARFWERLYEPLIRRAAGLGALSGLHDTAHSEKAFAFCDVLVIGAGPAGLSAALTAARAGAEVILADEDARMGGRLLSETALIEGRPAHAWVSDTLAELARLGVRLMPRTTVSSVHDGGSFGMLERVGLHVARPHADLPRECFWRVTARQAVLAAGAQERLIAFPMNDRPGVMQAGAVRSYLNRYGVAAGRRVAVFGNNDDAHRTARDLIDAGVEVAALIDSRPGTVLPDLEIPVYAGARVIDTAGRRGLSRITVATPAGEVRVSADCLAVSGGWNPAVHLTCHHNGRPVWDEAIAAFVPAPAGSPGSVPDLIPCGAATGRFTTAECLQDGHRAAAQALAALGLEVPPADLPATADGAYAIAPLWAVPGKGRAWLDMANDVTTKDVKLAAQEGFRSVEHMKRYTTQGMAPDQGRLSNLGALAVLADATGRGIPATGTTTYRPPFTPVSIAAMGAGGRAEGFAPQRFTTSHRASLERGAPMIEAGLWYRPSYFPRAGETGWRPACDREVMTVRGAVGVCDVSTLGKIDIQGADAGRFLDLVYTNMFSTLPVGRARYGLMLREDGHVMDDGTTARLGEHHYVMTTTTAAAGEVMRHLDFVQQAFCAGWDVRTISVTEAWAQASIAGPQAKALLDGLLDAPADLPFMGCGPVSIDGIEGRLFRISFSGEHAYELALPSRFGEALWRELVTRAEGLGGCAYGMEALNVLRIEKGFITHAEIHGRVTAFDIGLQGMMSGRKDFIGKGAAMRAGLLEQTRQQLVGLRPIEPGPLLTAGAHLFVPETQPIREHDQGYVTSVCHSPTLGTALGLGFLANGRARHGEVIRVLDRLRDIDVLCEVTDPVAFDKEGARARG